LGALAFGIIWFSRPTDVVFEAIKGDVPHSSDSRFAEVDGIRIHYQEKGSGTPLVLIHGYGSSTYTWNDVFDPLSRQFHVIALDLKGFGFSEKPEGDYTRHAQSDLVIHFMDYLKIDKAIICGNSMGGAVALVTAIHHPERVSRLILVDSAGIDVGGTSVAPAILYQPIIGPAIGAVALATETWLRTNLKKGFYDPGKITDERFRAYYRPLTTKQGQRAAFLARTRLEPHSVEAEVNQIHQPTLIIWGADDELIPLEASRRFQQLIQGSRLVVFEKCGHLPEEEKPDRFVEEVLKFL